jgi:hypothetical protein
MPGILDALFCRSACPGGTTTDSLIFNGPPPVLNDVRRVVASDPCPGQGEHNGVVFAELGFGEEDGRADSARTE